MLKLIWPYLLVALIGAGLTFVGVTKIDAARFETEKAAHAADLSAVSKAALDAEQRAIAAHDAAASSIAAADAQLTKERQSHEAENRNYRTALAAGTERVRAAVSNCSAGRDNVPDAASAAGVGDGTTAYADLDRAVAERVFRVAGDDDNEISKLKALQGYVCAIRPETVGCR
ncbi:MAG: lysis system i-spanin subunit Rz [Burkholderia gladioli]